MKLFDVITVSCDNLPKPRSESSAGALDFFLVHMSHYFSDGGLQDIFGIL